MRLKKEEKGQLRPVPLREFQKKIPIPDTTKFEWVNDESNPEPEDNRIRRQARNKRKNGK